MPEGTAATFTFESNQSFAGFECKLDTGDFVSCASGQQYTSTVGRHTFAVQATDAYGVSPISTRSWTVEAATVVPPTATITEWPRGRVSTTKARFVFTSDDPAATFECRFDGGPYSPCRPGVTYPTPRSDTYTFYVRAVSADGTRGPPDGRGWTVVIAAAGVPDTRIVDSEVDGRDATFSFTATPAAGASFQCKVDFDSYSSCPSDFTFIDVPPGSHTFYVRAVNRAGRDPTPASRVFVIAAPRSSKAHRAFRIVGPAGIAIVAIGSLVTLRARRRSRPSRLAWQLEAKDKEPSEICTGDRSYTWRHDCKLTPALRSVDRLPLSARTGDGGRLERTLDGELVDTVNEAVRAARSVHSRDRLPELLERISARLTAEIDDWLAREPGLMVVRIEAHLKGGKVECGFERFECVGGHWVKRETWKGEVEDESDEPIATVPLPHRSDAAARLVNDLRVFVERV